MANRTGWRRSKATFLGRTRMLRARSALVEGSRAGAARDTLPSSHAERGQQRVPIDAPRRRAPAGAAHLAARKRSVSRGAETDERLLERVVVVNTAVGGRPGEDRYEGAGRLGHDVQRK